MRRYIGPLIGMVSFAVVYTVLRSRHADTGSTAPWAEPADRGSDEEPVLGYDGMDIQAVLPWLESANLDRATLHRIRDYERRHEARQSVLDLIDDLLN